jgi:hypothetical protein
MKKIILYSGFVILLGACNKGFLNVNNNPNAPTSGAPALIFTGAETMTAAIINGGDFFNLEFSMNYNSLSTNYQVAYNITRNNFTSNDFTGVWSDIYHNLNDYLAVEQGSQGEPFLYAASLTMTALDYQMLVDGYNDVPFSQALQLPSGITNPAYDSAQAIYTACIGKLDSAISIFESDSVQANGSYNPGGADAIFSGSANSWVQLANTIKLRMLLHEINVTGQAPFIQSEAAKIAADANGCLGAGQTAFVNPGYATDAAAHLSPLWSTMGYSITGALADADQSANSYMIGKLTSFNDPRAPFFYCSNTSGQVSGNAFGIPSNANSTYVGSGIGADPSSPLPPPFGIAGPSAYGILQSPIQPAILLSSWESLFLQAEAAHRGLLPGGDGAAQTFYQQAIADNFNYLNVYTDGTTSGSPVNFAATYYAQSINNVGWTASTNKIQAIITQKYISLCFTNVEEAWTDFRRTGFPSDLPQSNDPAALYPYITRFVYPQSEYNSNTTNVNKEGTVTPVSPNIFWMQ